jgi:hypothetical protein
MKSADVSVTAKSLFRKHNLRPQSGTARTIKLLSYRLS